VLVAVAVVAAGASVALADDAADFAIDHPREMAAGTALFKTSVRKILIDNCVSCHGDGVTEGEYDLVDRKNALKGGKKGRAIVPGKPDESRLVKLISHSEEPAMPQDASKLADDDIAAIREWIRLGAPFDAPLVERVPESDWTQTKIDPSKRDFWAFQPLAKVSPPEIDEASCRNDIDRFIRAKQQEHELAPTAEASRLTLIRRAYLDLLGVPPTPEEVDAFVANPSTNAYDELVDRLLDDPRFGERWARHWLDVARFAESHGFEQDYDRPYAYHFRDFVIKAFNEDLPYDTFVRWQLAGDEIAPGEPEALKATGFVGAGVFPTQITANEVERTRYDALDDMAATTGQAFLGLSIGCARCHDHKFDPIPQADYYRFASTFTTTVRSNVDVPV
jgi:cytochrome c553